MKKILIIGANGMLGHMVATYLHETNKYRLALMVRDTVEYLKEDENTILYHHIDIEDREDLDELFYLTNTEKYDIILNCVGLLVKDSQEYPERAEYLNTYFPKVLSENLGGAKLIHISTDCVFKGDIPEDAFYTENDIPSETSIYGSTKAKGEIRNNPDVLTIRTSIIGPELKEHGTGLFHWFMKQTDTVKGYRLALWNGLTTLELAKAIEFFIDNFKDGLVHITPNFTTSKANILRIINKIFERGVTITDDFTLRQNKTLYSIRKDYNYLPCQSYKVMIKELKEFMLKHRDMYKQYL